MNLRKRKALLVSCSYRDHTDFRELRGTRNDLMNLREFLREAGFDYIADPLIDPADHEVWSAWSELLGHTGPADLVLLAFFGHGHTLSGDQLLLTRNSRKRLLDLRQQVVTVDALKRESDTCGAERVFLLDCCRDNFYVRTAGTRDLAPPEVFQGSSVLRDITARAKEPTEGSGGVKPGPVTMLLGCQDGQVSLEIPARAQGLFTTALLDVGRQCLARGESVRIDDTLMAQCATRVRELVQEYQLPQTPLPERHGVAGHIAVLWEGRTPVRVEPVVAQPVEVLALPQLTINSVPAGAKVWVDGIERGVTPLALRLSAGSYQVKAVLAGHQVWETPIRFTATADATLKIELETQKKTPLAVLKDVRLEADAQRDGVRGLLIHSRFTAKNMKGVPARVAAYIEYANGRKVPDTNGRFSAGGQVSVGEDILPQDDKSEWKDFTLFLPHEELHLDERRAHKCRFLVTVCLRDRTHAELAKSAYVPFTIEAKGKQPRINFDRVWVEHGILRDKITGMLIRAAYRISDLAGTKVQFAAYFALAGGTPLKDLNNSYATSDGHVAVSKDLMEDIDDEHTEEVELFMPVNELHLNPTLKHDCQFYLQAWRQAPDQKWVALARSGDEKFTVQRRPGEPHLTAPNVVAAVDEGWSPAPGHQWAGDPNTLQVAKMPSATFHTISVDHNVSRNGLLGMLIHVHFSICHIAATQAWIGAYFEGADGHVIKDKNGQFLASDGQVCVGTQVQPCESSNEWQYLQLFMPYDELHLAPKQKHKCRFILRALKEVAPAGTWREFGVSEPQTFDYADTPNAMIHKIWQEHNFSQDGHMGMRIHVHMTIHNMRDRGAKVAAYFSFSDGTRIKDVNGAYGAGDGQASVGENIQVPLDVAEWKDFELFMPYSELHLREDLRHSCQFNVHLWQSAYGSWLTLAKSAEQPFIISIRSTGGTGCFEAIGQTDSNNI